MGSPRSVKQVAGTIRLRAAEVFEKQREKMRRNLGTAIDGRDPEGVHDMRVASRRLRAALALFAPWLEKREVQRTGKLLRRLTRALGSVRELDVLRMRFEDLASKASPERKLAIEIIDSRIARARVRARGRMIKSFASIDLDEVDTRLRSLAGAPPAWAIEGAEESGLDAGIPWDPPSLDTTPDEPIETLMQRLGPQVSDAARRIVETKVPGESGSREASKALHEIRIYAKKLRYQLEIIAPHSGAAAAHLVDTLKGLQEHLGEFHDDSVLDEILADNISRQAARARPLLVHELRRLRTARRAALRRDERECRSSLDTLRLGGFARAVAELFVPIEVPAVATAPEVATPGLTPTAAPAAPPADAPAPRAAAKPLPVDSKRRSAPAAGYAGEPGLEGLAQARPDTSAPARAAGAAPNGAGLPAKN
ncbi:MAG: CHAD domain-containing protein [Candidatus Binatia bacterium]|nr:CHAD domain-containing protein [Candidatus Binatia bacterium]